MPERMASRCRISSHERGLSKIEFAQAFTNVFELILQVLLSVVKPIVRLRRALKFLDQVIDETRLREQHVKDEIVANPPVDPLEQRPLSIVSADFA